MARVSYKDWISGDNLKRIESWARDGLTDEQIANNIGCSISTLKNWKKQHVSILTALKNGKAPVDLEVENALLKRALGYEYEETETIVDIMPDGEKKSRVKKIKKVALPDTSAAIFWLKNRKPEQWRKMSPEFKAKTDSEVALNKAQEKKLLAEIEREAEAFNTQITIVDEWEEVSEDDNFIT